MLYNLQVINNLAIYIKYNIHCVGFQTGGKTSFNKNSKTLKTLILFAWDVACEGELVEDLFW